MIQPALSSFLKSPERLELEHCRCDLIGGRIGDRGRGLFEHEQPCAGDLACERLAGGSVAELR